MRRVVNACSSAARSTPAVTADRHPGREASRAVQLEPDDDRSSVDREPSADPVGQIARCRSAIQRLRGVFRVGREMILATSTSSVVSEGIVRIIEVEGPVVAKRAYDIYLRGCGIKRMGHELKSTMNKALAHAIRQGRLVSEDEAAGSGYSSRSFE